MARIIKTKRDIPYTSTEEHHRKFVEFVQSEVVKRHGVVGYDPVVAMALIGTDPALQDLKLKLDAHKEVAKYWRAQLNRTEISGPDGAPIQVEQVEVEEMLEAVEAFVKGESGRIEEK